MKFGRINPGSPRPTPRGIPGGVPAYPATSSRRDELGAGARAWALHGTSFEPLAAGGSSGAPALPPGEGLGYLVLHGTVGSPVSVSVE
ncbi:MAG: hypothetical protein WCK73_01830 [Deltaproteobacteria bacterium]